ncbi:hypothetical protein [Ornithinimicrobium cerasi]|uniref:Uncharacterized protein n=1 Tax=Ornithinimicrobium cerasi TaxID=2248773 RepID=A0A285VJU1_9MICO|nr:hypothetical protein [Ornithinimicrobium cerasi]SOC54253.1 hypothetical protein SAMN05421879_10332 [Ornithinimicrobium cerasi]
MGAWIRQGTGTLLMVTQQGVADEYVYRLDSDGELFLAPDDTGTVVVDDQGDLVLESTPDSTGCLAGSQVAVTDVRAWFDRTLPLGEALTGNATTGGCSLHEVLSGVWIRVS